MQSIGAFTRADPRKPAARRACSFLYTRFQRRLHVVQWFRARDQRNNQRPGFSGTRLVDRSPLAVRCTWGSFPNRSRGHPFRSLATARTRPPTCSSPLGRNPPLQAPYNSARPADCSLLRWCTGDWLDRLRSVVFARPRNRSRRVHSLARRGEPQPRCIVRAPPRQLSDWVYALGARRTVRLDSLANPFVAVGNPQRAATFANVRTTIG